MLIEMQSGYLRKISILSGNYDFHFLKRFTLAMHLLRFVILRKRTSKLGRGRCFMQVGGLTLKPGSLFYRNILFHIAAFYGQIYSLWSQGTLWLILRHIWIILVLI